ncbi:MAG: L-lactate permease [Candidatus Heimdallarchaeota archaeon]|nr:L-lactate permease [Candidatus Heimdallarchaeota archaeon]
MSIVVDVLLILIPFFIGIILLIFFKFKADMVGTIIFVIILIVSIFYFNTDWKISFIVSLAGIIKSFPISLMVLTSILMMTYMQKTGALAKLVVSFKKIGGGNQAFQIMIINLALGTFLVSIGATPVTMLPPVLAAMGYSAFSSVALPAIGYDPLCTYALLAVPASFFADFMGISLVESGRAFSYYMPLVTLGIAMGMLWLAGGKKLLFSKDALLFGVVGGLTAGCSAVLVNMVGLLPLDFFRNIATALVPLTGVIAGLITGIVLVGIALLKKIKIVDHSVLTEEEKEIDKSMPLAKALSPWLFLIVFVILTNLIPPVYQFLHTSVPLTINLGEITINTAIFSHAYFWVLIATLCSIPILGRGKDTLNVWLKRSIRPVYAAAIFFAIAYIIIYSGTRYSTIIMDGSIISSIWYKVSNNNMINILAIASADVFGNMYPLIVPFIGLFAGFISGSETSAIAMFTNYHAETATALGISALAVGTANGVGGGLASVLSPAKIQNAAAVIDQVGIEGEVIRKTAPIALLMTLSVAAICLCWANNYIWWKWIIVFSVFCLIVAAISLFIYIRNGKKVDIY